MSNKEEITLDQLFKSISLTFEAMCFGKPRNNEVTRGRGFYLSYNPCVTDTEQEETALCFERTGVFWILIGDYRKEFKPLIKKGIRACKKRFMELLNEGSIEGCFSTREE